MPSALCYRFLFPCVLVVSLGCGQGAKGPDAGALDSGDVGGAGGSSADAAAVGSDGVFTGARDGTAAGIDAVPDGFAHDVGAQDASGDAPMSGVDAAGDLAGREVVPPRPATCFGRTTNLTEDPANCGACGNYCWRACSEGACADNCASHLLSIGRVCVDGQTNPGYCGIKATTSGDLCDPNEQCSSGRCVAVCKAGEISCNGTCVDPRASNDHCGTCGTRCPANTGCMKGVCLPCAGLLPLAPKVPTNAYRILTADVDSDGDLDLVLGGSRVLLTNGDGSFTEVRSAATTTTGDDFAVGDVDGDGKVDVVESGPQEGLVAYLRGLGDGTFAAEKTYPVPSPGEIALVDLDKDGKMDVVAAGGINEVVHVLRGSSAGLEPVVSYDADGGAIDLAVGDINEDGLPDVVVAEPDSTYIRMLYGVGDGTLAAPKFIHTALGIRDIAIADIDNNGQNNILANIRGGLRVYHKVGESHNDQRGEQEVGAVYGPMVFGDINGDDRLDLIFAGAPTGGNLIALLSRDYGTAYSLPLSLGVADATGAAVGDFNRDGKVDIVAATRSSGLVLILAVGGGAFATTPMQAMGSYPLSLTFADLDGDRLPEIIVPNRGQKLLSILRGKARGTRETWTMPEGAGPAVAAADLDGDGKGDLVLGYESKKSLTFFLSSTGFLTPTTLTFERTVTALALGDWNADGKIDLATANADTNDVTVVLGQGGARLGQATHYPVGAGPKQIFAADLDGDGKLDLLTADTLGKSISLLRGDGTGVFAAAKAIASGVVTWVELGDFDGNGIVDIAVLGVLDGGGSGINVLLGQGGGVFGPPVLSSSGGAGFSVGDVNGDGRLDVFVPGSRSMSILTGQGDGKFAPASVTYPMPISSGSARLSDLNQDGVADVVMLDTSSAGMLGIVYGIKDCRVGG